VFLLPSLDPLSGDDLDPLASSPTALVFSRINTGGISARGVASVSDIPEVGAAADEPDGNDGRCLCGVSGRRERVGGVGGLAAVPWDDVVVISPPSVVEGDDRY
jgi:hypothetical protein